MIKDPKNPKTNKENNDFLEKLWVMNSTDKSARELLKKEKPFFCILKTFLKRNIRIKSLVNTQ